MESRYSCSEGGAGHALALEFAAQGLRVIATARSKSSLASLEAKGIETLLLDVTSLESINSLKAKVIQSTGGKLDILFNNAGISAYYPFIISCIIATLGSKSDVALVYEAPAIEVNHDRVHAMFDTNCFGLFNMVSAFTPLLLASVSDARHPPTIINTASVVSRIPFVFSAAYNASKAAVVSYSDTLRIELAPLGVKVVTLFMGEVSTSLFTPETINFGPQSLYTVVEQGAKDRSRYHMEHSMSAPEFAKQVVHEVLHKPGLGKGEFIWKGTNAWLVWLLNAIGWRKIFDGTVEGAVGFNKTTKESMYENSQRLVKQG